MRRGGFAPLAWAVALALALIAAGGGTARASSGTIPCTVSVTDASGTPITTVAEGTIVYLTGTATGSHAPASGLVTFVDELTGLDVTGSAVSWEVHGLVGVATQSTQSLRAGDHPIHFAYIGDDGENCASDAVLLHVGDIQPTHTTTSVSLSSPTIEAGQTIDITASVVQAGTTIAPPGGRVTFWSKRDGDSDFIQMQQNQIGLPLDANGQATLQNVGGFQPGRYTIQARYAGDTFQWESSRGEATLTMRGSSILTYLPSDTVVVGGSVRLSAKLTNAEFSPAVGERLVFTVAADGATCEALTGNGGIAACTVTTSGPAGVSDVAVTFAGDDVYDASSKTGQLTINRAPTSLVAADVDATYGSTVPLTATLTNSVSGAPISGQQVVLSVVGSPSESCPATTNASGVASCDVTITDPASTYSVNAAYAGTSSRYLGSSDDATLVVTPAPTTLTYTGSAFAVPGSSATISFVLNAGTTTLVGQPITITFDGVPYNTTTNASGVASIVIANPTGTAPHTATASFEGDDFYGPSSQTQTIPSGIPTSIEYIGDVTVVSSGTATLKIKLTDTAHSTPVAAGASVTITLASGETCTVVTDSSGIGSCTKRIDAAAGADAVTASYAGVLPYLSSTGSGSIDVSATRTALVLTPVTPTLRGSSAQLGGFLVSTQTAQPLAGKTVTLTLGTQSCFGTTNSLGFATCTIPSVTAPIGLATVKGTFAGDAFALTSTALPIQAIVYGLAPGNCWFVIGDRDADGHVNFWGAQWWKNNHLSRSSSDSSFKGLATSRSGSTWTSKPGNSSSPPAGPLPAYMAVIVSSSMSKSGSTISGDVAKVVIVRTDAGYDANPGHAGTGTVVATLP